MNKKYYTLKEVSDVLKTPVRYLRQMIKEKKLKAYLIGRSYKVEESDLNDYIYRCRGRNEE